MEKQTHAPNHIGIILDGNRRWAKERGLPTLQGHKRGAENLKKVVTYAQKKGIKIISVYAFSTENWNRTKKEVDYLMNLLGDFIGKYLPQMQKEGVQLRCMGSLDRLPAKLRNNLIKAVEETKNNSNIILNIGINYGGRDELERAVKKIVEKGYSEDEINSDLISQNLDTAGLPDPDLIIRTSGEQRVSGFMTWQSVYSELYFPKVYWPDFDEKELDKAVEEFNKRQRRFGN